VDEATVLSPRTVSVRKGRKGLGEGAAGGGGLCTPHVKSRVTEGVVKPEGGSLIEGLLRLAETPLEMVQGELGGTDAPSVMSFLHQRFGPVRTPAICLAQGLVLPISI
jgi:hypothetical protein